MTLMLRRRRLHFNYRRRTRVWCPCVIRALLAAQLGSRKIDVVTCFSRLRCMVNRAPCASSRGSACEYYHYGVLVCHMFCCYRRLTPLDLDFSPREVQ